MYPRWGPIAFFWQLGRWFGQTISPYHFWRVTFVALGGQKSQHDDSLGPCASIHHSSTLFLPAYGMGRFIDGKFRRFAAKIDDFISTWMFRGGQRQISRGADSKHQHWYWMTKNHNYSMVRASNDSPQYTRATSMPMKGSLYRCGSNGGKLMWKFDDFIVNLGDRRPPRKVRAYGSTNNHKLNNTIIEAHQDVYLVEFYG